MRRHVRIFKPRFETLLNVTKFNTIRPPCKRPRDEPQPGDLLDCRVWSGRPYNSKQRHICFGRVERNHSVIIHRDEIEIGPHKGYEGEGRGGQTLAGIGLDKFAKADGFFDWRDMRDWFEANHGLPVIGFRLIKWEPCVTVATRADAERIFSNGGTLWGISEMDESLSEIKSLEMLAAYTPDSLRNGTFLDFAPLPEDAKTQLVRAYRGLPDLHEPH